jgi:hypothetical protein
MSQTPSSKARPFLSREAWLTKRQARRDGQREQNITRAAQMHEARLAHVLPPTKRQEAAKLSAYYVGCSGWFYRHWRGRFYPAGSKTSDWFTHYAKKFHTVELNAPFYAWPTVATVKTWKKQRGRRRSGGRPRCTRLSGSEASSGSGPTSTMTGKATPSRMPVFLRLLREGSAAD